MARTALIAGSTGLVGGFCLKTLIEDPGYSKIIALTRRPATLEKSAKVEARVVSFEQLSVADVFGAEDIFCALGTTIKKAGSQAEFRKVDFDAIVNLARAAVEGGAKRFIVVSSVGADPNSGNFYLRIKGETEQAIAGLPFEAVHIMRPSFLIGQRQEKRAGEAIAGSIVPRLNWAFVGSLRKYRAIDAATVARAMVKSAEIGEKGVHVHHYDEIVRLAQR